MRILHLSLTHRIKNKFEQLIDTVFGIMLLGTNCIFYTINCTIKFGFIKSSTNHFAGH